MLNPIRYDIPECSTVQWRLSDEQPPWFAKLVELSRGWLERKLGIARPSRIFYEAEERFDAAVWQTYRDNPQTQDGGVLL